eukprot:3682942-Ditylum_brightwellii.AAC.1
MYQPHTYSTVTLLPAPKAHTTSTAHSYSSSGFLKNHNAPYFCDKGTFIGSTYHMFYQVALGEMLAIL